MNQNAIDAYKRAQTISSVPNDPFPRARSSKPEVTKLTSQLHIVASKIRMMAPVVEGLMAEMRELTEEVDVIARKIEAHS